MDDLKTLVEFLAANQEAAFWFIVIVAWQVWRQQKSLDDMAMDVKKNGQIAASIGADTQVLTKEVEAIDRRVTILEARRPYKSPVP